MKAPDRRILNSIIMQRNVRMRKCTLNIINTLSRKGLCAAFLLAAATPSVLAANCRSVIDKGFETVTFGDIIVQRDAPVGSTLATLNISKPFTSFGRLAACTRKAGINPQLNVDPEFKRVPFKGEELFDSGVPGIAIRVLGLSSNRMPRIGSTWCTGSNTELQWCAIHSWGKSQTAIELVKTGPTGAGEIKSGNILIREMSKGKGHIYTTILGTSNVFTVACAVTSSAITVPLGRVFSNQFSGTGVGSTSHEVPFNIGLGCDAQTRVNLTLDGIPDGGKTPGVLRLTPDANIATGAGCSCSSMAPRWP
ncbi:fimbrial protein [Serratia liquefaciens]|uniref:fimbrial protein n=1 Tax=Serratia liquefaciens TaxID=614 RepID=UPI00165D16C2|nr:hypothetical protein [Serratia liquefaciens]QNQ55468.1 hypothetical protein IAI46_05630 [Serratia liquefaciens]